MNDHAHVYDCNKIMYLIKTINHTCVPLRDHDDAHDRGLLHENERVHEDILQLRASGHGHDYGMLLLFLGRPENELVIRNDLYDIVIHKNIKK